MHQLAAADPAAARHFARILVASVDILIRVVHDLQKPDATRQPSDRQPRASARSAAASRS
jgi:hypothetical protein